MAQRIMVVDDDPAIRKLVELRFCPVVVMLSARDNSESMDTGLAAGADDYLLKPPDLDELVDRVSERLRQRSVRLAG